MKKTTKKHKKQKSKTWKIFKIVWLVLFVLIVIWTLFWLAYLPLSGNLGEVIIFIAFFTLGVYALAIFIGISILILLIRLIVGLVRRLRG